MNRQSSSEERQDKTPRARISYEWYRDVTLLRVMGPRGYCIEAAKTSSSANSRSLGQMGQLCLVRRASESPTGGSTRRSIRMTWIRRCGRHVVQDSRVVELSETMCGSSGCMFHVMGVSASEPSFPRWRTPRLRPECDLVSHVRWTVPCEIRLPLAGFAAKSSISSGRSKRMVLAAILESFRTAGRDNPLDGRKLNSSSWRSGFAKCSGRLRLRFGRSRTGPHYTKAGLPDLWERSGSFGWPLAAPSPRSCRLAELRTKKSPLTLSFAEWNH